MVPPFDHELIVIGQATAGLEILEQLPDVAAVLAPIGGGGLVAGVSAAIKQSGKNVTVEIIGVEPTGSAAMKAAVDAGRVVTLPETHSVADGLLPVRAGEITFAHVQKYVDRVVTVDDESIVAAVVWIFANAKVVAEPSGAVTTAAVLSGALDAAARVDGPVVAIISGGNMDAARLAEFAAQVKG
jgi:threonine dehydratase